MDANGYIEQYKQAQDDIAEARQAAKVLDDEKREGTNALYWKSKDEQRDIERAYNEKIRAVETRYDEQIEGVKSIIPANEETIMAIRHHVDVVSKLGKTAIKYENGDIPQYYPPGYGHREYTTVPFFAAVIINPAINLYAVVTENDKPKNKWSLWVIGEGIGYEDNKGYPDIKIPSLGRRPSIYFHLKDAPKIEDLKAYFLKNVDGLIDRKKIRNETLQKVQEIIDKNLNFYYEMSKLEGSGEKVGDFKDLFMAYCPECDYYSFQPHSHREPVGKCWICGNNTLEYLD